MKSPAGYDLNKPVIINLSKKIDEISGIAYSSSDSSLFAIDDNTGFLYKIRLTKGPDIQKWEFGKKADYEDLVLVDSAFYILESSGKIIHFPLKVPITEAKIDKLELKGFNEFETLYYDADQKRLVLLCKECKEDGSDKVSAYGYAVTGNEFSKAPVLTMKREEVEKISGTKMGRLKVSAGNINPLTGEIFIISSINKVLIVMDNEYNIKGVYELQRNVFGHPEGLCFAPDGTLFISNEAGESKKANVLIFKKQ